MRWRSGCGESAASLEGAVHFDDRVEQSAGDHVAGEILTCRFHQRSRLAARRSTHQACSRGARRRRPQNQCRHTAAPSPKEQRGSQHRLAGRPAAGSSAHAPKYFGQSAHHHLTRPISANVAPACMQGRGNDNCSSKTPNQDHKQGVATSSRRQEPARTVVELCLRGRGPRPLVYRKPRFPCVFAN